MSKLNPHNLTSIAPSAMRRSPVLLTIAGALAIVACTSNGVNSGDEAAHGRTSQKRGNESSGTAPLDTAATTTTESAPVTTSVRVASATQSKAAKWTVTSVVDGDTLDVEGPAGHWRVRLIGINAPEQDECMAPEAGDALENLTKGKVALASDVSDEDQYHRKLRYVETADGVDVGAAIVRRGLAISRRYEPDTARNRVYERSQKRARAAGVGLWAKDACGPAISDVSMDVTIHADAAGDDNENLNDEWVRFTNVGGALVDLRDWQVADESASHRYTFSELPLAPNASVTLYTGCGGDDSAQRYWCNEGSAVWNNSGDTVFLKDPKGNILVAKHYEGG